VQSGPAIAGSAVITIDTAASATADGFMAEIPPAWFTRSS
jgi:hypothetical protein